MSKENIRSIGDKSNERTITPQRGSDDCVSMRHQQTGRRGDRRAEICELQMAMDETNEPKLQLSTYDKLNEALIGDDKDSFLSIIDDQVDAFRPRQQDLLHEVCRYPSVKCAEALITGKTPLTVDLNLPTSLGMYPLHSAAESCWPSITELFLYYGARTDLRCTPAPNKLSCYSHKYKVEECTNKLPLHMSLLRILYLPWMREWIPYKHPLFTLFFLLGLPRMQNPLETLGLLLGATKEADDEFYKLAMDAKIVEVAALLMAAKTKLSLSKAFDHIQYKYGLPYYNRKADGEDISNCLHVVLAMFDEMGKELKAYVQQDKYNVNKYQVIKILKRLLGVNADLLDASETDLTIYNWYRDEDCLYRLKAPYECIRRFDDIGMEHYSQSGCRWRLPNEKHVELWRVSNKELKPASSVPYEHLNLTNTFFAAPSIFCQRVPKASSGFCFDDAVRANKVISQSSWNYMSKTVASLASILKPIMKRI